MAEVLKATAVSQRELARRLGKSHVYVAQRLILLNLVPELRTAVDDGELKIELAREFGELSQTEQQAIVAAGKPYRRPGSGNGVTRPPVARSIRITSPAAAAESIRQKFNSDELAELIRLLTST
jgi:ParB family chromosome partitioning protein